MVVRTVVLHCSVFCVPRGRAARNLVLTLLVRTFMTINSINFHWRAARMLFICHRSLSCSIRPTTRRTLIPRIVTIDRNWSDTTIINWCPTNYRRQWKWSQAEIITKQNCCRFVFPTLRVIASIQKHSIIIIQQKLLDGWHTRYNPRTLRLFIWFSIEILRRI